MTKEYTPQNKQKKPLNQQVCEQGPENKTHVPENHETLVQMLP